MFESRSGDDAGADRTEGTAAVDRRYFLPAGRHGMVELAPDRCPSGHPLGPDTVLIASHPCGCTVLAHRIWRCWVCDLVWVRPPCAHHPEWLVWSAQR